MTDNRNALVNLLWAVATELVGSARAEELSDQRELSINIDADRIATLLILAAGEVTRIAP
jgi:hypothetical protein